MRYLRINFGTRCSLSKCLSALTATIILIVLWFSVKKFGYKRFTQTCNHPEKFLEELHNLSDRVHNILTSVGLTHFLCYGSLWGQLRQSKSLPWESDVEFCLLNEEIVTKDEVYFHRSFKSKNLKLEYDSAEGTYIVTDKTVPDASVQLIVFERDPLINMLRRVGWKRRVLPPDCDTMSSLNCFPPRLIKNPLPQKEFGGYVMPVPREGIEIQKYHYPTDWWKETLPKNC